MFKGIQKPVVLFDGYCNLCSGSVIFIVKRERGDAFRFASLQSDFAQNLISKLETQENMPDSIVLIENNRIYTRSTAALRIVKRLRRLWPALYIFILIPRFIRDPIYDFVAKNRYRWFGKRSTCFIPDKDMNHKFLDQ